MKNVIETPVEMNLTNCDCDPSEGRLQQPEVKKLLSQLRGKWKLKDGKLLERTVKFDDFKQALDFTNQVGELAESQEHHPDILLTYGEVRLQLSTHSAKGLTKNDFILAAKINELE